MYEKSVKVPVAAGTEGCQRMRRIPWGREKEGREEEEEV